MGRNQAEPAAGPTRRRFRAPLKLVLPTVAALGVGAAAAAGAIPGSDGVIRACYANGYSGQYGTLRVIDPSLQGSEVPQSAYQCDTTTETPISWNQQGPTGPTGAAGQQGPQGVQGPQGPAGPSGVSVQSGPGESVVMQLVGEPGKPAPPSNAIELKSFSLESTNSVSIGSASTGAGAGKAKFTGFKVVKLLDNSSVALFQYLTTGSHFKQVNIMVTRSSKGKSQTLAEYRLGLVFLTNIKTASAGGAPTETVQGEFGALQFAVTPQQANGQLGKTVSGGWNQVTNTASTSGVIEQRRRR